MCRTLFLLGAACVAVSGSLMSAPVPEWPLPEAEGQKWAARISKLISRDNWKVELKGNEITVRRTQAVAMVRVLPSSPPDAKPIADGEKAVRFVLRFAPPMSVEEYEKLQTVNEASEKEYDRLHRAVGLRHKFGDFLATTPEEKERVRAFEATVAKLPRHTLPDLHTPDHSIFYGHCWDGWSHPADEAVRAEINDVEETLMRFFGLYDPRAAARGRSVGKHLPEPRK